jgi:hypothetical protein
VVSSPQTDGKIPFTGAYGKIIDLSERSHVMPRNEAILWPNQNKDEQHPSRPDFRGALRLAKGPFFRVALWQVADGFSLYLTLCDPPAHLGAPPSEEPPIKCRLLPTRSGEPQFSGQTPEATIEMRAARAKGKNVWWLRLIARKEVAR